MVLFDFLRRHQVWRRRPLNLLELFEGISRFQTRLIWGAQGSLGGAKPRPYGGFFASSRWIVSLRLVLRKDTPEKELFFPKPHSEEAEFKEDIERNGHQRQVE